MKTSWIITAARYVADFPINVVAIKFLLRRYNRIKVPSVTFKRLVELVSKAKEFKIVVTATLKTRSGS